MINYREIKLQNLYLETKNIIYLEVMLGIIDPDERINILDI